MKCSSKKERGARLPAAITRTPDGGFVIAGVGAGTRAAWATRVTSDGIPIWRHDDEDPATSQPLRSSFSGALMLSDGSTLLCGSKLERWRQVGLLTHISATGELIDKRILFPKVDDEKMNWAGFHRCIAWNDGFALVGGIEGNYKSEGWLVRLDAKGSVQWEMVSPELGAGTDAIETADHSLVEVRTEFRPTK